MYVLNFPARKGEKIAPEAALNTRGENQKMEVLTVPFLYINHTNKFQIVSVKSVLYLITPLPTRGVFKRLVCF